MIVASNSTAQTLQPGQSITFDLIRLHTGCGECHRQGSSSVKLRCQGIYEVEFSGNIGGSTGGTEVRLSITLGGEVLPETTMKSMPGSPGDFNNVATKTFVRGGCGDYSRVTVTNTGTAPVVVDQNTCLAIGRRSG